MLNDVTTFENGCVSIRRNATKSAVSTAVIGQGGDGVVQQAIWTIWEGKTRISQPHQRQRSAGAMEQDRRAGRRGLREGVQGMARLLLDCDVLFASRPCSTLHIVALRRRAT